MMLIVFRECAAPPFVVGAVGHRRVTTRCGSWRPTALEHSKTTASQERVRTAD
jgi:hypothetical protein